MNLRIILDGLLLAIISLGDTYVTAEIIVRKDGTKTAVVTTENSSKIKKLVEKLDVDKVEKGKQAGISPRLQVRLTDKGGKVKEYQFLTPTHLDQSYYGQVYLKTDAFYKAVIAVLKEHNINFDLEE
jgi:hypothetical protein